MRRTPLHRWDLAPREAIALQRDLAGRVRLEASPWGNGTPGPILVAGADVSCARGARKLTAAVVVVRLSPSTGRAPHGASEFELVAATRLVAAAAFPYVPGLLSFREAPSILNAIRNIERRGVSFDVLLVDGQGMAHPRGLGLASHLGLWLGLPSVGCAKSRLCGEHDEVGAMKGDSTPLVLKGRRIGTVLRSRDNVKPLFVSPGHMVDFEDAVGLVSRCLTAYRLPEPTRLAHRAAGFKGSEGKLASELKRMLDRARPKRGTS